MAHSNNIIMMMMMKMIRIIINNNNIEKFLKIPIYIPFIIIPENS